MYQESPLPAVSQGLPVIPGAQATAKGWRGEHGPRQKELNMLLHPKEWYNLQASPGCLGAPSIGLPQGTVPPPTVPLGQCSCIVHLVPSGSAEPHTFEFCNAL